MNNQYLGMVVQWEDRFFINRIEDTYLGSPDHEEYHETKDESMIFPDFVTIAKGFGVPAERVTKMSELRGAIERIVNLGVFVGHHGATPRARVANGPGWGNF